MEGMVFVICKMYRKPKQIKVPIDCADPSAHLYTISYFSMVIFWFVMFSNPILWGIVNAEFKTCYFMFLNKKEKDKNPWVKSLKFHDSFCSCPDCSVSMNTFFFHISQRKWGPWNVFIANWKYENIFPSPGYQSIYLHPPSPIPFTPHPLFLSTPRPPTPPPPRPTSYQYLTTAPMTVLSLSCPAFPDQWVSVGCFMPYWQRGLFSQRKTSLDVFSYRREQVWTFSVLGDRSYATRCLFVAVGLISLTYIPPYYNPGVDPGGRSRGSGPLLGTRKLDKQRKKRRIGSEMCRVLGQD